MKNLSKRPIALAVGAAFALTGAAAQASVFQFSDLGAGYMVASAGEAKGEAKRGDAGKDPVVVKDKAACDQMIAEGKCGEGKCGGGACDKAKPEEKPGEGKSSEKK